jgi:hypothetical protein
LSSPYRPVKCWNNYRTTTGYKRYVLIPHFFQFYIQIFPQILLSAGLPKKIGHIKPTSHLSFKAARLKSRTKHYLSSMELTRLQILYVISQRIRTVIDHLAFRLFRVSHSHGSTISSVNMCSTLRISLRPLKTMN